MAQPPRGDSREVALGAKSDVANTYVVLECNPSTKALKVEASGTVAATQSGNWDINDISKGTQTNDVKVTLDSEAVVLGTGSATVGEVTIGAATTDAGDLAKAEDAAHASGDVGVMALAVENEDQADLSTGDKDYTPIAVTKEGNVIIKPEGTITVDGTVTANAGTNLNTSALALDANWVADDGVLGKGILIQGDDGTDRKNINVDATTGDVQVDVTNTVTIANTSITGPGAPTIDSYTHASINLAAGANQVLVSSAASKQIWVYGIGFTVNAAGTVSFQDEDDTAITGVMNFAASSGMGIPPSGNFSMPIWKLGTDKDLEVDIVTSELDGWIDYAVVSV